MRSARTTWFRTCPPTPCSLSSRSSRRTMVNEAKFGVNRANYHNWSYGIAPVGVSVSSASFSGLSSTSLDTEVGTTFSYIDNLTLVRGRHTLQVRRQHHAGSAEQFRQHADHARRSATPARTISSTTRPPRPPICKARASSGNRRTFYQGYAQDEFKVTPNLTLNLGLRYEFYSVAHEILESLGGGGYPGLRRFLPQGHGLLRTQLQGLRPARRAGLGARDVPRQDHHPQRLRHLLRRQSKRRLLGSRRERRAALLAFLERFPGFGLSAGGVSRSEEPALQPQGASTAIARTSTTRTGTSWCSSSFRTI